MNRIILTKGIVYDWSTLGDMETIKKLKEENANLKKQLITKKQLEIAVIELLKILEVWDERL